MAIVAQENTDRKNSFIKKRYGPLTSELDLTQGSFGLGKVPLALEPDATTTAVCGFCSTGCGLNIHMKDGEAINLTPDTDYSVNEGMACVKGWEALSVLETDNRGTIPLLRSDRGKMREVGWDHALKEMCRSFKQIQSQHGPESVAFLSTGQIVSEEMAFLGALAKFGMGMVHGDGNTRQCMATAVVAYKQSLGFDAPPYCYQDFEESDVIVLVGSNLCIAHPIMWQRILNNPNDPALIVVDPRRTETAMSATHHLAIQPKSDLDLFYGLAHILINRGAIDREYIEQHTSDFNLFKTHVASFSPDKVARATGITVERLHEIAQLIQQGKRVSFWWTMGVNQSYQGVRTAQSIINLALMTGNFGRPGTGANSITGQCNAMGSRLFSNTTNLLGGHEFTNDQHRRKVADILEIPECQIPNETGWAYDQIIEGILRNKIKGLWVVCTNPAHSWINQNMCQDVLERLDFLVVQDMYRTTETAQMSHLYLPAAAWGEKEGTFINSERRFGLVKKVAKAPGQSLSDFSIFKLVAEYWGCGKMFEKWQAPEDVFQILKKLAAGQPCDISAIEDYQMLDATGGIQWPYADKTISPTLPRRLFEDGKFYHPDERAKFIFEQPAGMPEPPSPKFPYLLLTGRGTTAQWHTQTRTHESAVLRSLYAKNPYVEINYLDARRENIRPNQWVIVESQRGRIRVKAFVTTSVSPGQVFMSMHSGLTNQLTHPHFDPHSRQPSYKDCAVLVRPLEKWD